MNTFILALFAEHGKLKPSSLFHLLNGKRTTSILSFGFFHDLLALNGVLPNYSQKAYEKTLADLLQEQLLEETLDGQLQLTQKGRQNVPMQATILSQVDYFSYGRNTEKMWRFVQFVLQVTSYLGKTNRYLPLETSPEYTERVRQLVRRSENQLPNQIYKELTQIFSRMPKEEANYLAQTFSGYHFVGQASYQLVPQNFQEMPWAQLFHDSQVHHFFHELAGHPDFILYHFLQPYYFENENQSMGKTRQLFLKGYSREQIMKIRHIKSGTINDHLIEWALRTPDFPFERFISSQAREKLQQLSGEYQQWDYREITAALEISFEEFRLYQIMRKMEEGHA